VQFHIFEVFGGEDQNLLALQFHLALPSVWIGLRLKRWQVLPYSFQTASGMCGDRQRQNHCMSIEVAIDVPAKAKAGCKQTQPASTGEEE
jgi:hypothetical protein